MESSFLLSSPLTFSGAAERGHLSGAAGEPAPLPESLQPLRSTWGQMGSKGSGDRGAGLEGEGGRGATYVFRVRSGELEPLPLAAGGGGPAYLTRRDRGQTQAAPKKLENRLAAPGSRWRGRGQVRLGPAQSWLLPPGLMEVSPVSVCSEPRTMVLLERSMRNSPPGPCTDPAHVFPNLHDLMCLPGQLSPLAMQDLLQLAQDIAQGCHCLEENHFIHSLGVLRGLPAPANQLNSLTQGIALPHHLKKRLRLEFLSLGSDFSA
ncbi:leukocyte tyrosine kinase receptor isoform X2 [Phacochoerus africanus]|uniref:leukocyte tyrosine kinase receptor isoform X2 n=1 Tax=Phacochoerus africanus TaxID=41426 RepID=UPI001FDA2981|nr:leukocyte tyrosine kinase receptor isoform X2 [Phacochoerus africanus]